MGNIKIKGIETEISYKMTGWLKMMAGYTYIDGQFQKSNELVSRYIMDNLRHQFIGKVETKFLGAFTNEIVYRYNERMNLGSYQLLDEKLSFTKKIILCMF